MPPESTPVIEVARHDPQDARAAERLLRLDQLIWADDLAAPHAVALANTPTRAAWTAWINAEPAGIAGSWDIEVSVPDSGGGATLRPVEGLTWVGVHPDYRRRGVLTALMHEHLRWTRDDQGRALAALKASEAAIYGRYGYAMASRELMMTFAQGVTLTAPPAVEAAAEATMTRMTPIGPEHASRLAALSKRCGTRAPGHVVRAEQDYVRILTDVPETRPGREPAWLLWATRDGEDVGCARFHRTPSWATGSPDGRVEVQFVVDADPGARLALARRLTSFDLMSTTEYWISPSDPLVLWQTGARPRSAGLCDDLWLRIVDLPRAVTERGHATDLDLAVEVSDHTVSDNAGTWRWRASQGYGQVTPAEGPPEITLDITDLGAVWLGGQSIGERAAAGYITELRPGAVAELDATLRTLRGPVPAVDF